MQKESASVFIIIFKWLFL